SYFLLYLSSSFLQHTSISHIYTLSLHDALPIYGNVSVAVTNGATICPIKPWTSIPNHIVMVAKSNKTIAVGINASNERATDGGTCSGMVIRIPLTILQRYISTAIIAEIIPTNIPPAPRFSIGNRKPS